MAMAFILILLLILIFSVCDTPTIISYRIKAWHRNVEVSRDYRKHMEVKKWLVEAVAPSEIGLDIIGITAANPDYNWFLIREGGFLTLIAAAKPPPIESNPEVLANILGNTEV